MSLFKAALESARSRLVVVVQGNPKYLNNPKVAPLAVAFYERIRQILESRGFTVEFDPGKEQTLPNTSAYAWVGHSRGIDRLRFAPHTVKTLELQTQDHAKRYANHDEQGTDPAHYELSPEDVRQLKAL